MLLEKEEDDEEIRKLTISFWSFGIFFIISFPRIFTLDSTSDWLFNYSPNWITLQTLFSDFIFFLLFRSPPPPITIFKFFFSHVSNIIIWCFLFRSWKVNIMYVREGEWVNEKREGRRRRQTLLIKFQSQQNWNSCGAFWMTLKYDSFLTMMRRDSEVALLYVILFNARIKRYYNNFTPWTTRK